MEITGSKSIGREPREPLSVISQHGVFMVIELKRTNVKAGELLWQWAIAFSSWTRRKKTEYTDTITEKEAHRKQQTRTRVKKKRNCLYSRVIAIGEWRANNHFQYLRTRAPPFPRTYWGHDDWYLIHILTSHKVYDATRQCRESHEVPCFCLTRFYFGRQ